LFTSSIGGWLYDVVDRGAPFFLIGAVNMLVMAFGVYLMRTRPSM
jgi:hypothetical protein